MRNKVVVDTKWSNSSRLVPMTMQELMSVAVSLGDRKVSGKVLRDLDLSGHQLTDVTFLNCDFRGVTFRGSVLNNVTFLECYMAKVSFRGADVYNSTFENCNLLQIDAHGSRFIDSTLTDCNLAESDLSWANLQGSTFTNIDFSGANVSRVRGYDIHSVNNIGTFRGAVTYDVPNDIVFAGCWNGSLEDFLLQGIFQNAGSIGGVESINLTHELFNGFKRKYTQENDKENESRLTDRKTRELVDLAELLGCLDGVVGSLKEEVRSVLPQEVLATEPNVGLRDYPIGSDIVLKQRIPIDEPECSEVYWFNLKDLPTRFQATGKRLIDAHNMRERVEGRLVELR